MVIKLRIKKAIFDSRFRLFFHFVIAFVLAAAVTIDQQSKNLIKLLVAAGVLVTIFNWQHLRKHASEYDPGSILVLSLYFFSLVLSIVLNPLNEDTSHDFRIMSIGFTSIFIWSLMVSIRFRTDFFWWGILLCALSTGIYALLQLGVHGVAYRAEGSSGKPIMFGDIAMISGILSITAMDHFRKYMTPLKFIPVIAAIMGITASILSGSRGGWVFFPLALLIYLFFVYTRGKISLSLKTIVIGLVLLSSGLILTFTYTNALHRLHTAYQEIHTYFSHQSDAAERTSLGQRFVMWQAALDAFEQYPIFGMGPGTFDDHLAMLAEKEHINRQVAEAWKTNEKPHPHTHAHNEYLNTLATRGLFGISTVLLLFFYFLYRFAAFAKSTNTTKHSLGLAGVLLVSGYMIFSLSESVLYHEMTANFFFLTLVALMYLSRQRSKQSTLSDKP